MRSLLMCCLLVSIAVASPVRAYNILALDTGGYWTNLSDQYFGAQPGYGAPGVTGERWYTMVEAASLATINLLDYDVLLVQSGFTDDWVLEPASEALAALSAKASDIHDFVQAGNGLVAWSEPLPAGVAQSWDWAPVSLVSEGTYHENQVEILDPSHPLMANATNGSLSDWHSSWHGWFDSWDARLHPLAGTGDFGLGDPRTDQVITLAGSYWDGGCGRMVFSMQDPDYHAYQGFAGGQSLIRDALDWSATCQPVPEPASGLLVLAGLLVGAGTAILRRR